MAKAGTMASRANHRARRVDTRAEAPFVPLPETIAFLYSLPLPPGVTTQPQPASQQDWALVEQYRLLCQSLHVLGDFERARRADGLEPYDFPMPSLPVPAAPENRTSSVPTRSPPTQSIHEELASHSAVAQLSQSLSSFPSSSFTFTSSGSIADGSLSLDLSLPLDLDSTSGPASLPSLMSAISELEHCVARLSLEANEARTLQKSLRTEMATRQHLHVGDNPAVLDSSTPQQQQPSAKKNGKQIMKTDMDEHHGACQDCGEDHANELDSASFDHNRYQLDLEYEHQQLQRQANEVVAAATGASGSGSGSGAGTGTGTGTSRGGLGVKSWEDRELMKALESVSLLDKRADEYRERLKVLKEQIHHHAALADALAAQNSTGSTTHRPSKSSKNGASRFGDVPSDTGMRMVNAARTKSR